MPLRFTETITADKALPDAGAPLFIATILGPRANAKPAWRLKLIRDPRH